LFPALTWKTPGVAGWRSWLQIPTAETEPRQALLWVRRMEILTGIGSLAFGVALWSHGWWHWLPVGAGVLGLSPWPGARAILRKSERKPEILISDREQRRRRKRRALMRLVPPEFLFITGLGYVFGGVGVAITAAILGGIGVGLGAWLSVRMDRPYPGN
jgi:TRAP-type mannitol/chloroaromatic compound transport system permease large subunit